MHERATRQNSVEKRGFSPEAAARPAGGRRRSAARHLDALELEDGERSVWERPPPRARRAHGAERRCAGRRIPGGGAVSQFPSDSFEPACASLR